MEIFQKKNIHPVQYLLVGLALCLFYTLLVSTSEHIGFTPAYIISALMTTLLITFYMGGILKIKKNRAFVEQQNGEVEVASGQYVYLKVENCWIPVVVRYSARRKKWYFKYLEEIPVCGQKVLLKA